jgi:hypothetical protein
VQPSYEVILGKNEVKMSQVTWTCVRSVLVTGDAGINPKSSVRETAPYAFNVSYNASNVMLKVWLGQMSQEGLAKIGLKLLGINCHCVAHLNWKWVQRVRCDGPKCFLGQSVCFSGRQTTYLSTFRFGLLLFITRTKHKMFLGLTAWVELSLGL